MCSQHQLGLQARPGLLVVMCCALLVLARPAWSERCDPELFEHIPTTADVVLVVDGAADLLETPSGKRMRALLEAFGATEQIQPAWANLAAQLEMKEADAFEALIGRRVAVALSGVFDPMAASPEWVVISEVDSATERRLRSRLKTGARRLVRGHQVLAVEGGAYELATHRHKADSVTLVLGPSGATGLFDGVLEVLNGRARAISEVKPAQDLARLGASRVLLLARLAPGSVDDYLLAGLAPTPDGIEATMLLRDRANANALARIDPSSDAPFRALSHGALAAVLEAAIAGEEGDDRAPGFLRLWGMLGAGEQVRRLEGMLGSRQAMAIRAAEAPPGIGVSIAIEVTGAPDVSRACDAFMNEQIGALRSSLTGERTRPTDAFEGMFPGAVRTASIERAGTMAEAGSAMPDRIDFGWVIATDASGGHGWWVAAATPADPGQLGAPVGDVVRATAARLGVEKAGEPREMEGVTARWYSVGVVHPRDLAQAISPSIPDVAGWRSVASRVARVEWRFSVTPDQTIVGDAELVFSSDEP